MISIKQIQNFLVLAETLHFGKAAARLRISQATLSSEIKRMEQSVGAKLFDRSDKWSIKLTVAGASYYNSIKNVPNDIINAQREAVKSARGEIGTLAVAVSSIAYDYINFGMICKKMSKMYPELKLKILDMPIARNRFDVLSSGKADIVIFAGSCDVVMPENFIAKKLFDLKVALVVPVKSHWALQKDIRIEDLKNTHFIMPPAEEAPNWRRAWNEIFMEHCQSLPLVTQEVAGLKATLQFVTFGLGVGFMFMRQEDRMPEGVVLRELPVKMNRALLAGYREMNYHPAVNNFLQILTGNIP